MTQSIIVYRNPAEQQFWEGGYAFPTFAALVVLFVVVLGGYMLLEHIDRRGRKGLKYNTKIVLQAVIWLLGAVAFFAVLSHMML